MKLGRLFSKMGHHNGLWLAFSEDSGVEKLLNHESYRECSFSSMKIMNKIMIVGNDLRNASFRPFANQLCQEMPW